MTNQCRVRESQFIWVQTKGLHAPRQQIGITAAVPDECAEICRAQVIGEVFHSLGAQTGYFEQLARPNAYPLSECTKHELLSPESKIKSLIRLPRELRPSASKLSRAVLGKLSVAQLPVLPQFQHCEHNDDGAKDEVPISERASVGVAKNEW
jgi:hypothetical protein